VTTRLACGRVPATVGVSGPSARTFGGIRFAIAEHASERSVLFLEVRHNPSECWFGCYLQETQNGQLLLRHLKSILSIYSEIILFAGALSISFF
ncbi:MAG: hypothetical protein WBL88_13230, partial [Nitrososphaeraceae archaeon]